MDGSSEINTLQHFIGGEWTDAEDGGKITSFNPIDDSVLIVGIRSVHGTPVS